MRKISCYFFLSILGFNLSAQQIKLTVEDAVLKQRTTLAPDRLSQLAFIPATTTIWWVTKSAGKECVVHQDAENGKVDTLLHVAKLNEMIQSTGIILPKIERFPFMKFLNKDQIRFFFSNVYFQYTISKSFIEVLNRLPNDAENPEIESKSGKIAFVQNNNVMLYSKDSYSKFHDAQAGTHKNDLDFQQVMLTSDGSYMIENGKSVHRNEFGINKGLFWSPTGKLLAFYKQTQGGVLDYPLLKTERIPAFVEQIKYPMAGGMSHHVAVNIHNTEKKITYPVIVKGDADQYLTNVAFSPDESHLYIAIVNRDQNSMQLNRYDATTGAFIKTLFVETHDKYVEPEQPILFLKNDNGKFIWQSERDGFNHLYLYNFKGEVLRQLTKGNFDVKEVLGFDAKGLSLYYMAATNNGLDRHCFKVEIATGKTTQITLTAGVHQVMISDNDQYIIDSYSNLFIPRKIVLNGKDGKEVRTMLNANDPLLTYQKPGMKLFNIKAADGITDLNCRMFYPHKMDSSKKYPVLVYVYGGPHAQMITNSWLGGADLWLYYMAQQGYLVFTVDNRGSANRGLGFEQATFRQLGNIEREDQLKGVEFLKSLRYVDANRMGVFGWSFGGFMTVNLMSRADVFKAGVAGGPVIDWRMYEIMYTERYMDKPDQNIEGFKEADMTNYIKDLKGKLMVIHGTDDDVVVWQHSINYVKKCVDEGKQIDYFMYPGHKHNVLGKDRVHLMQKITDYFNLHL